MVNTTTYIKDTILLVRNDFRSNVTDPISTSRAADQEFVMTSYPQRTVTYPIITIRHEGGTEVQRMGMRSELMWMRIPVEIRIWARNEVERDSLTQTVINRLRSNQFGGGSSWSDDEELHDLTILSSVPVDEDGDGGTKSMVITIQFLFVLGS